jgi:hypothetical protein
MGRIDSGRLGGGMRSESYLNNNRNGNHTHSSQRHRFDLSSQQSSSRSTLKSDFDSRLGNNANNNIDSRLNFNDNHSKSSLLNRIGSNRTKGSTSSRSDGKVLKTYRSPNKIVDARQLIKDGNQNKKASIGLKSPIKSMKDFLSIGRLASDQLDNPLSNKSVMKITTPASEIKSLPKNVPLIDEMNQTEINLNEIDNKNKPRVYVTGLSNVQRGKDGSLKIAAAGARSVIGNGKDQLLTISTIASSNIIRKSISNDNKMEEDDDDEVSSTKPTVNSKLNDLKLIRIRFDNDKVEDNITRSLSTGINQNGPASMITKVINSNNNKNEDDERMDYEDNQQNNIKSTVSSRSTRPQSTISLPTTNNNGFKITVSNLHPKVTEDDVLVIKSNKFLVIFINFKCYHFDFCRNCSVILVLLNVLDSLTKE